MCFWCVFGVPLITALCSLAPLFYLCGALWRPTPSSGQYTYLHQHNCLPRSPLLISEARVLCHWAVFSRIPLSFDSLCTGGGAACWPSSPAPGCHPITVPPSGGWAEGLHSKLLALDTRFLARNHALLLLLPPPPPPATTPCTGAVAAAAITTTW